MLKKAFQIRRTQSRQTEVGPKPTDAQIYNKTPNPNTKPELNQVPEAKQGTETEKIPKSAPLNQSKRAFRPKTELKDMKELYKPNLPPSKMGESKTTTHAKVSRHSRISNGSEEGKKNVVIPKREKTGLPKPPYLSKRVSEEPLPDPLDLQDVNAVSMQIEDEKKGRASPQDLEVRMSTQRGEQQAKQENTAKQMEFTLAGFTPPKKVNEMKEESNLEKTPDNLPRLQDDSSGEQFNSQLKNPSSVRGMFAKEHIPTSELLKKDEQKRLMKEYLDFQTNEKKRKKEEEKMREAEFDRREDERIRKEIQNTEEREIEVEKKSKVVVEEMKRSSPIQIRSSRNSRRNMSRDQQSPVMVNEREIRESQELKKSQDKKELGRLEIEPVAMNNNAPREAEDQIKVDKLVEENLQLRNENTKKMEIIDILLTALKQKGDSALPSTIFDSTQQKVPSIAEFKNTGSRFMSNLNTELETLAENKTTIKVVDHFEPKPIASPKNFKFNYNNESLNEDRQNQPYYDRPNDNYYPSNSRLPITTDANNMIGDINKFAKLSTPVKGIPYKMFTPTKKEHEYSNHNVKNESSPRIVYNHRTPSGLAVPGSATEMSRGALKKSLLPGLTPSSSQLPYRSNLMNNGDQIVNGIRNYDNFRLMETPFKKEDSKQKEKMQNLSISSKQSQSETVLKKAEVVYKGISDIYPFNETFHPSPYLIAADAYAQMNNYGGGSSQMNEPKYHTGLSAKAEIGMLVLDDGSKNSLHRTNIQEKDSLMNLRAQGSGLGTMGPISVVDMALQGGNGNFANEERTAKFFSGGNSERRVITQVNDNKAKFPKEVFSVNVKKRFYA